MIAERVTAELMAYLADEARTVEPEAAPLLDELSSLVGSGGKRLRPRFCYWGFRAAGGADGRAIIRTGAALELLHTMALICDDVMDASAMRRSRETTFRALAELSSRSEHRGDPQRFGMSAAILTGMLGLVLADRLFWRAGHDESSTRRAADRYDALRSKAIAGQYLDLVASHRGHADEATAIRIAALKAGSYSVADPLAIGSMLASADLRIAEILESYGQPLGEAFQIRDDVLGMFGASEATGKDRDGDIRDAKQTVLLAKARTLANDEQLHVLDQHLGNPGLSTEDADRVREVIEATGALDATNELIVSLTDRAVSSIDTELIDTEAREALCALADAATVRQA